MKQIFSQEAARRAEFFSTRNFFSPDDDDDETKQKKNDVVVVVVFVEWSQRRSQSVERSPVLKVISFQLNCKQSQVTQVHDKYYY